MDGGCNPGMCPPPPPRLVCSGVLYEFRCFSTESHLTPTLHNTEIRPLLPSHGSAHFGDFWSLFQVLPMVMEEVLAGTPHPPPPQVPGRSMGGQGAGPPSLLRSGRRLGSGSTQPHRPGVWTDRQPHGSPGPWGLSLAGGGGGRRVGGADSRAVPGLTSAERDRPAAQRGGSLGNRWGGRLAGAELSLGSRAASPEAAGGTAQAPGASGKSGRLSARSCPRVPAPANRRDSPAAVPSPPPAAA